MEISSLYSKSFSTLNYKIEYYVLKANIFKSKENNQNSNDEHDCTIWTEIDKNKFKT